MEVTTAASLNTELTERLLWYDGDSTVNADELLHAILNRKSTKGLYVSELTPDIEQYNRSVTLKSERIGIKENIRPLSYDWRIPDEYKNINITEYVVAKLMEQSPNDDKLALRAQRVADELELYKKLELMDVLRTLIFVINTLIENNVVWGVGRGSSVSSYVLYLMGVHDVDSFKYGLNIEEFLRTE